MEFNNKIPIYKQLVDIVVSDIIKGNLKPGDKINSIRETASQFNLNVNTVSNAFKELENRNILINKRGLGYFITENLEIIQNFKKDELNEIINEFLEKIKSQGYSIDEIIQKIEKERINYEQDTRN